MVCRSAAAAGVQRCAVSGAQHLLQASVHFFFFDKLAPVGLRDAFLDSRTKGRILKQTQGCVLNESLGVGASVGGDSGKLRFLLGREMYFHVFQNTRESPRRQPTARYQDTTAY